MEIVEALKAFIVERMPPHELLNNFKIGSLPPQDGLSIAVAAGGLSSRYMCKGSYETTITFVLNGKSKDQKAVESVLTLIHKMLNAYTGEYGTGSDYYSTWKIVDVQTSTWPAYTGQQDREQWLYGSSIQSKVIIGGL